MSESSFPMPVVPMTYGQIFDRTYRLMRAHFGLFLGIAAVPASTLILILLPIFSVMLITAGPQMQGHVPMPPAFPPYLMALAVLAGYVIMPLIFSLYMPAASYAATQADVGVRVTFKQAYGVAWQRFGRYLWLMVLASLYVIVPMLACVLALVFGGILLHVSAGDRFGHMAAAVLIPLGVLLYIAALVYAVLITLRFSLAYPASVVEGLPAWTSLKRSAQLTEGAKGRIFLVLLVVYACTYAVSLVCVAVLFAVAVLVAVVAMTMHVTAGSPAFFVLIGLGVLGYLLLMVVVSLFSYAANTTALGMLYHDQRRRKDGPATAPPAAEELPGISG